MKQMTRWIVGAALLATIACKPGSISLPGSFKMNCGQLPATGTVKPLKAVIVTVTTGSNCVASFEYWTAGTENGPSVAGTPGRLTPETNVSKIRFRCALDERHAEKNEECVWTVR